MVSYPSNCPCTTLSIGVYKSDFIEVLLILDDVRVKILEDPLQSRDFVLRIFYIFIGKNRFFQMRELVHELIRHVHAVGLFSVEFSYMDRLRLTSAEPSDEEKECNSNT